MRNTHEKMKFSILLCDTDELLVRIYIEKGFMDNSIVNLLLGSIMISFNVVLAAKTNQASTTSLKED